MQTAPVSTSAERERRWYPRRVIVATLLVLLVTLGFYLLYLFSNVLFVLFVAAVLATALRPAVLWLERYHIPPSLGTLLLFAAFGAFTVGLIALLAPILITQVSAIVGDLPSYYASFRDQVRRIPIWFVRDLAARLPAELPAATQTPPAGEEQVTAVAQAISYVRAGGWSVFGGIAIALITFFWIVDREQIVRAGLLIVPVDRRDAAHETWDTLEEKVGAFIRGQALLCLSIGVLSGIAFFAIGLPNALLLAVLAGILEAVPYVGPIATALIAIVLTLAEAPEKIWWVIGACVVIQQIENAILVPRIMDRAVGVNAVVTLLAIAAFGTLLGIGGAIMAIPLAVIIQVLIERTLLNTAPEPAVEIEGRDHLSVLRYEAQDLASDLRGHIRERDPENGEELPEEQLEAIVGEIDELLQNMTSTSSDIPTGRAK
jgi:predicted PurR-regulated permease PerM